MDKKQYEVAIPDEVVMNKIYLIRTRKVMLDKDLAELYGVETKQLKRAVRRNVIRFPDDFMFELNKQEIDNLRCLFGTSSWGGTRYAPMAFTEQGVAMLSSILNSDRAIKVNIQIIRIFSRMRQMLLTNKDLLIKMDELEKKVAGHDEKIHLIFDYLKQFIKEQEKPRTRIGFKQNSK
ncbi:ORF6N domain-containing protein [Bacteroidota bacterium]